MAAVAAATSAATPIDLRATSTFPLRLGASVLKSNASRRYTNVRYNHKPKLSLTEDAVSHIRLDADSQHSQLVLEDDGGDEYTYFGKSRGDDHQYVLVFRGEGSNRTIFLEKLATSHDFNLVSTPTDNHASQLAEQYPQLTLDDDEGEDLFGDDDELDTPADDENPFDFRHFLKAASEQSKAAEREAPKAAPSRPAAPTNSTSNAAVAATKPTKRADTSPMVNKPKRKAPNLPKPHPKRVKAGAESPPSNVPAAASPEIPRLKLDRKASIRRRSIDNDDGELILENETPVSEKPRQGAMALALQGQLGRGPISLRSAASSPASRMESPMAPRPADVDEDEEFEFGGITSPEDSSQTAAAAPHYRPEDDELELEADADIEDLNNTPAQQQRSPDPQPPSAGVGDDEDDLDKQLAMAFDEDDTGPPPAAPAESDEESEEE